MTRCISHSVILVRPVKPEHASQCEWLCCVYMQRALRGWRGSASLSGLSGLTFDLWQLTVKQQQE